MVDIPFVKAHGLGNDYLIVNAETMPDERLACLMCDRRTGVGADGLIVLDTDADEFARFRIFNADGSEAELCGNGLRCAALFLAGERAGSPVLESAVGRHHAKVSGSAQHGWQVAMDLVPAEVEANMSVSVGGAHHALAVVRVGNPHAVLLLDSPPADGLLQQLAAAGEAHERFPDGINTHIAWPAGTGRIAVVSWERGVGSVRSCATGAAAAAAAGGGGPCCCDVQMDGGTLTIEVPVPEAAIRMTGPAALICEGVYRYAAPQP